MNGYYQDPQTQQIVFVGNAALNPQLTQGKTFLGANLPEHLQGGQLPKGATGTNQQGVPGNWETNPSSGLNEFVPLGSQSSWRRNAPQGGTPLPSAQDIYNQKRVSQADENEARIRNQVQGLKLSMDAASLAYINSIETTYNALIEQQKRINRGLEGSLQQSLIQGGSQRYAQLSSAGLAATQMSFGLGQIAEWEGKKQSAIAQAKLAQGQNNFKLMEYEDKNIQKYQEEKEAAMKELSDTMVKQNKAITEAQKPFADASREQAIAGAIAQFEEAGIDDPTILQNYLNYNEAGEQIGNISLKEIEAVQKIKNASKKKPDEMNVEIADAVFSAPELFKKLSPTLIAGIIPLLKEKGFDFAAALAAPKKAAAGGTEAIIDKPLSINQISQFQKLYGWTPPFGFSQSQLLQFMQDNPNATPDELQSGANSVSEGQEEEAVKPTTTPDEAITSLMNTITDEQLKKLKTKADAAGISSFFKNKKADVENYLNSIKDKIEEALQSGFGIDEIIAFLTL